MKHTSAEIVQRAIAAFRSEATASEIAELADEQLAAGTSSLEWYGRTITVLERFLSSNSVSDATRSAIEQGINAGRLIFGATAKPHKNHEGHEGREAEEQIASGRDGPVR